jgi:hypothetical protein
MPQSLLPYYGSDDLTSSKCNAYEKMLIKTSAMRLELPGAIYANIPDETLVIIRHLTSKRKNVVKPIT